MRRAASNLAQSITFAGHALMLAIVGVAILMDHVVGVAPTRANAAVGIGMILSSALLVMDAFDLLTPAWRKLSWVFFIVVVAAFAALNFF